MKRCKNLLETVATMLERRKLSTTGTRDFRDATRTFTSERVGYLHSVPIFFVNISTLFSSAGLKSYATARTSKTFKIEIS